MVGISFYSRIVREAVEIVNHESIEGNHKFGKPLNERNALPGFNAFYYQRKGDTSSDYARSTYRKEEYRESQGIRQVKGTDFRKIFVDKSVSSEEMALVKSAIDSIKKYIEADKKNGPAIWDVLKGGINSIETGIVLREVGLNISYGNVAITGGCTKREASNVWATQVQKDRFSISLVAKQKQSYGSIDIPFFLLRTAALEKKTSSLPCA